MKQLMNFRYIMMKITTQTNVVIITLGLAVFFVLLSTVKDHENKNSVATVNPKFLLTTLFNFVNI